uniref:Guanylate cyclase domain-containing protein n=1 Tax=candidate division WOR-3 bacterium TaxID=2052148 RepID=A0A7C4XTF3_UNCW3
MNCPNCNYARIFEGLRYCPNCGSKLFVEPLREEGIERLKSLGGEFRLVIIAFVNFAIKSPESVGHTENVVYLAEMMEGVEEIVKKYEATVNRIIPDNRLLIIFGVPRVHSDDKKRALNCLLEIRNYCNERIRSHRQPAGCQFAIGVHNGWAFFGYILEEPSFLTVIGDTVNVGARLASICPPNQILLSEDVYNLFYDMAVMESIGKIFVKGRAQPIEVFNLKDARVESYKGQICPLLGREREMERLINLAQRIKGNRLGIAIITGQMGIGKTRLKEEFENYLSQNKSFKFMESHCTVEMQTPYYPFKLLLREYFRVKENENREKIAEKIDLWAKENNLDPLDIKGIKNLFMTDLRRIWGEQLISVQEEIYVSMKNLLKFECRKNPLIIIFEEFNRADPNTKNLLNYLILEMENEPIMFLLINFGGERINMDGLDFEEINLGPLSAEAISDLVKFYLIDVEPGWIDFLYKISGGNPLLAIEAVKNMRRRDLLKREVKREWHSEKEEHFTFLGDLYTVVMSGLDALSLEYRSIIDYASVIGYSFNYSILNRIMEKKVNLLEKLDYLKNEGYIVQFKDEDDPVYLFRHNLLRDAAYTTIPQKKRKEIHHLVASLFEETYSGGLSEHYESIGYHYQESENYGRAAEYFKLAGDKSKNLYAIDDAMNFYNLVLKIGKEHKNQIPKSLLEETELNLADLYEISGDIQKMKEVVERGIKEAERDKDLKMHLLFTERKAVAHLLFGEFNNAEELLINALENCPPEMPEVLAIIYSDLGLLYAKRYEYEKSVLNYNLNWNIAHNHFIKEGETRCLLNLANLHTSLGNYELAIDYLNYGLQEVISNEDLYMRAQFKFKLGNVYYQIWNLNRALEEFQEAYNLAERISYEIGIKSNLEIATIYSIMQEQDKAMELIEGVDKKIMKSLREILLSEVNLKKAMVYKNKKDYKKAHSLLVNSLKGAQKYNQKEIEVQSLIFLSEFEEEKEFDYLKSALEIAETIKLPPLIVQAMFKLTKFYAKINEKEKAQYYGQRALLTLNDIKSKLKDENQVCYTNRPEFVELLKI